MLVSHGVYGGIMGCYNMCVRVFYLTLSLMLMSVLVFMSPVILMVNAWYLQVQLNKILPFCVII